MKQDAEKAHEADQDDEGDAAAERRSVFGLLFVLEGDWVAEAVQVLEVMPQLFLSDLENVVKCFHV